MLERRGTYSRCNILHLWDWICADLLALGVNGAEILGKSFFHIGTRNVQVVLARLALVLGVNIVTHCEALEVVPPSQNTSEVDSHLWGLKVKSLLTGEVELYSANVVGPPMAFTMHV